MTIKIVMVEQAQEPYLSGPNRISLRQHFLQIEEQATWLVHAVRITNLLRQRREGFRWLKQIKKVDGERSVSISYHPPYVNWRAT
jgi:hypothetical protein